MARGINLAGLERVLEIPQKTLKCLYEEEGPAPPETEMLLNMVLSFPLLVDVAQANFDLSRHVKR